MSVKKLQQILSDRYGKIVMDQDVPVLNTTKEGAPVYDQNWIESSWSRLLKQHGILCEEPGGDKSNWVRVEKHGDHIKGISSFWEDRTDCWIPLDLSVRMLFIGALPDLNSTESDS